MVHETVHQVFNNVIKFYKIEATPHIYSIRGSRTARQFSFNKQATWQVDTHMVLPQTKIMLYKHKILYGFKRHLILISFILLKKGGTL